MEIVAAASSSPPLVATIYARKDVEEIEGGEGEEKGKRNLDISAAVWLVSWRTDRGRREGGDGGGDGGGGGGGTQKPVSLLSLPPDASLGLEERGDERRDSIRPRCCFHISPIFYSRSLCSRSRLFFERTTKIDLRKHNAHSTQNSFVANEAPWPFAVSVRLLRSPEKNTKTIVKVAQYVAPIQC